MHEYGAIIRRQIAVVAALLLLGAITAAAYTLSIKPQYTVTLPLYIGISEAKSPIELATGTSYVESQSSSFAAIATSGKVLRTVRAATGNQLSLAELEKAITVSSSATSSILTVRIQSDKQLLVAPIAKALPPALNSALTTLVALRGQQYRITVSALDTPKAPSAPSGPDWKLNLALGAIIGLLLGLSLATMRERRRDTSLTKAHYVDSPTAVAA